MTPYRLGPVLGLLLALSMGVYVVGNSNVSPSISQFAAGSLAWLDDEWGEQFWGGSETTWSDEATWESDTSVVDSWPVNDGSWESDTAIVESWQQNVSAPQQEANLQWWERFPESSNVEDRREYIQYEDGSFGANPNYAQSSYTETNYSLLEPTDTSEGSLFNAAGGNHLGAPSSEQPPIDDCYFDGTCGGGEPIDPRDPCVMYGIDCEHGDAEGPLVDDDDDDLYWWEIEGPEPEFVYVVEEPWYQKSFPGFGAFFAQVIPGVNTGTQITRPRPMPPPPIVQPKYAQPSCWISAQPREVAYGAGTKLEWATFHATRASISTIGEVAVQGSRTVPNITSEKTFVLSVAGPGGNGSCYTRVGVRSPQRPASCIISANPDNIRRGQTANIAWGSENAERATLSTVGSVNIRGGIYVQPTKTTDYTLTVYNSDDRPSTCVTRLLVR